MSLKHWFLQHKRSFPWRDNPSPYAVWISEIMLQQTRAVVVVDYFNRWMELFPSIETLATAPLSSVIKAWEGLGYYNRVRNIKAAAEFLYQNNLSLPNSLSGLLAIKGIGPYTAGAILSFAFHQKATAIDGNVKRVISRYFGQEDPTSIEKNTFSLLPDEEPWITMEALIELGATLCQKKPNCRECPLQGECFAYKHNKTDEIPKKKQKNSLLYAEKEVALILYQGEILVQIEPMGKVLGGLTLFPSFLRSLELSLQESIQLHLHLSVEWIEDLPPTKQTFTNHVEELFPSVFQAKEQILHPNFTWIPLTQVTNLPFSSGHKRILQSLQQLTNCLN